MKTNRFAEAVAAGCMVAVSAIITTAALAMAFRWLIGAWGY
jgi:hypothetical protein